jgi:ubiquinone/menaquinone biosynthesis C-methylase UbiE
MSVPKGYINTESLQIVANVLSGIKRRSYDFMHITTGDKVLDLGCGPGTDTIPLAPLVGKSGQVIGADYDKAMLAEADQRARQAGVNAWVKHHHADAASLPFDTHYFDSCRCERLFQHLVDPEACLAEMIRVTKPGGWLAILDPDWGTLSIDCNEVDIERRYTQFLASTALHNGYSGRTLHRLFKQKSLTDITFEVFPVAITQNLLVRQSTQADRTEQQAVDAGVLSSEELHRWRTSQEQADAEGVYFASVNLMLFAGRKP